LVCLAGLGLAVPTVALTAPSAGAAPPGALPPGLQPHVVNVTQDPAYIFGEPEVAVNPKNPNNVVYVATKVGSTPTCILTKNPNCVSVPTAFGPLPAGDIDNVPGFAPNAILVSFDRGQSWKSVPVPTFPPPFPDSGFFETIDPGITVGPDGTFYFSEDVTNFWDGFATGNIGRDGAVVVSKSTDGGRTWSTPVLTGTPQDRPFITIDASTGMIYEASGHGPLGTDSTANPNAPNTGPSGRWLVASTDGVHWTTPAFLGAGVSGPYMSAAEGVFATGTGTTNKTFCGSAPRCEVLQTTTDAGLTWTQHAIPNSSDSSDGPLVAADPSRPGHFTVAFLNAATTALYVTQTTDNGATWSGLTVVTQDPSKVQWKPWLAYSSDGRTLGLMWRTWEGTPNRSPYSVWTTISSDGGATFSPPLEVSDGDSAIPWPQLGTGGDDFSFITLSAQDAFVSWGDWRNNDTQGNPERQGFMSVIKLQAFDHR
jgi:photosystem II stability/assembly factor-like uncharacterized protein